MNTIDDNILMSYVDGELDDDDAREFEARLAQDADLRALVRDYRQNDSLLRAAFKQSMLAREQAVEPSSRVSAKSDGGTNRWGPLPLALAASFAILAIGAVIGLTVIDTYVEREFDRRAEMSSRDSSAMIRARDEALEKKVSGSEVSWKNPDSGSFGNFVPTKTWRTKTGQYCREFEKAKYAGGVSTTEYGVACRINDGHWKVRVRYYPG